MIPLLKEIAEQSKRSILLELRGGAKTVTELVNATGMKQPNVSNHLARLRAKGLVKANKVGRQVYYSLGGPSVESALLQFVEQTSPEAMPRVHLEEISKQYARAAVSGDEAHCTRMVDQLIRQGVPLVRIYHQVLGDGMGFVGKWYEVEAIDVGQEHIASAITERMMARVVHFAPPIRNAAQTCLIGCVAGNWHSIGPRMISDYLRLCGWKAIYLGANVPTSSFGTAIKEHKPDLVLLSVAFEEDRDEAVQATRTIAQMRGEGQKFFVGVGGKQALVDPDEFIRAGADFTAANLMVFAEEVLPRIENGNPLPYGVFLNHKKVD